MEDYSVGSLSDLITGSNTPNKNKVVKKQIQTTDIQSFKDNVAVEVATKSKFKKQKKGKITVLNGVLEKGKKRKASINKNGLEADEITSEVPKKKKKRISEERIDKLEALKEEKSSVNEIKSHSPKNFHNSDNASRRLASKEQNREREERKPEDPEILARTVFVGNLPLSLTPQKFKRLFAKYGKVECVRIRGVPVANPKTTKKVAIIKKEFHPERNSFYGFVRYYERNDAVKALEENGTIFQDHHLRVHLCDQKMPDENKAIFVGNVNFSAEEDDLWKVFESCGQIESVRIVRDSRTGMGKGFGYVNFKNSDSVTLALEMENVKLKDRELRISICNVNAAKKNKPKKVMKPRKLKTSRMEKNDKVVDEEKQEKENGSKTFQGFKFMEKKKKKFNKGLLQKKKKIKQIAPK